MSRKHDNLVARLNRIERGLADQRLAELIAERIDVLHIANATVGELGYEDGAVYDLVTVARFLIGEEDR